MAQNAEVSQTSQTTSSVLDDPDGVLANSQEPLVTEGDTLKRSLLNNAFSETERTLCNTSGSNGCSKFTEQKMAKLREAFCKAFKISEDETEKEWLKYCQFIDEEGDLLRRTKCHVDDSVIQSLKDDSSLDRSAIMSALLQHVLTDDERTFASTTGSDGSHILPKYKLDALKDAYFRITSCSESDKDREWKLCCEHLDSESRIPHERLKEKLLPMQGSNTIPQKDTNTLAADNAPNNQGNFERSGGECAEHPNTAIRKDETNTSKGEGDDDILAIDVEKESSVRADDTNPEEFAISNKEITEQSEIFTRGKEEAKSNIEHVDSDTDALAITMKDSEAVADDTNNAENSKAIDAEHSENATHEDGQAETNEVDNDKNALAMDIAEESVITVADDANIPENSKVLDKEHTENVENVTHEDGQAETNEVDNDDDALAMDTEEESLITVADDANVPENSKVIDKEHTEHSEKATPDGQSETNEVDNDDNALAMDIEEESLITVADDANIPENSKMIEVGNDDNALAMDTKEESLITVADDANIPENSKMIDKEHTDDSENVSHEDGQAKTNEVGSGENALSMDLEESLIIADDRTIPEKHKISDDEHAEHSENVTHEDRETKNSEVDIENDVLTMDVEGESSVIAECTSNPDESKISDKEHTQHLETVVHEDRKANTNGVDSNNDAMATIMEDESAATVAGDTNNPEKLKIDDKDPPEPSENVTHEDKETKTSEADIDEGTLAIEVEKDSLIVEADNANEPERTKISEEHSEHSDNVTHQDRETKSCEVDMDGDALAIVMEGESVLVVADDTNIPEKSKISDEEQAEHSKNITLENRQTTNEVGRDDDTLAMGTEEPSIVVDGAKTLQKSKISEKEHTEQSEMVIHEDRETKTNEVDIDDGFLAMDVEEESSMKADDRDIPEKSKISDREHTEHLQIVAQQENETDTNVVDSDSDALAIVTEDESTVTVADEANNLEKSEISEKEHAEHSKHVTLEDRETKSNEVEGDDDTLAMDIEEPSTIVADANYPEKYEKVYTDHSEMVPQEDRDTKTNEVDIDDGFLAMDIEEESPTIADDRSISEKSKISDGKHPDYLQIVTQAEKETDTSGVDSDSDALAIVTEDESTVTVVHDANNQEKSKISETDHAEHSKNVTLEDRGTKSNEVGGDDDILAMDIEEPSIIVADANDSEKSEKVHTDHSEMVTQEDRDTETNEVDLDDGFVAMDIEEEAPIKAEDRSISEKSKISGRKHPEDLQIVAQEEKETDTIEVDSDSDALAIVTDDESTVTVAHDANNQEKSKISETDHAEHSKNVTLEDRGTKSNEVGGDDDILAMDIEEPSIIVADANDSEKSEKVHTDHSEMVTQEDRDTKTNEVDLDDGFVAMDIEEEALIMAEDRSISEKSKISGRKHPEDLQIVAQEEKETETIEVDSDSDALAIVLEDESPLVIADNTSIPQRSDTIDKEQAEYPNIATQMERETNMNEVDSEDDSLAIVIEEECSVKLLLPSQIADYEKKDKTVSSTRMKRKKHKKVHLESNKTNDLQSSSVSTMNTSRKHTHGKRTSPTKTNETVKKPRYDISASTKVSKAGDVVHSLEGFKHTIGYKPAQQLKTVTEVHGSRNIVAASSNQTPVLPALRDLLAQNHPAKRKISPPSVVVHTVTGSKHTIPCYSEAPHQVNITQDQRSLNKVTATIHRTPVPQERTPQSTAGNLSAQNPRYDVSALTKVSQAYDVRSNMMYTITGSGHNVTSFNPPCLSNTNSVDHLPHNTLTAPRSRVSVLPESAPKPTSAAQSHTSTSMGPSVLLPHNNLTVPRSRAPVLPESAPKPTSAVQSHISTSTRPSVAETRPQIQQMQVVSSPQPYVFSSLSVPNTMTAIAQAQGTVNAPTFRIQVPLMHSTGFCYTRPPGSSLLYLQYDQVPGVSNRLNQVQLPTLGFAKPSDLIMPGGQFLPQHSVQSNTIQPVPSGIGASTLRMPMPQPNVIQTRPSLQAQPTAFNSQIMSRTGLPQTNLVQTRPTIQMPGGGTSNAQNETQMHMTQSAIVQSSPAVQIRVQPSAVIQPNHSLQICVPASTTGSQGCTQVQAQPPRLAPLTQTIQVPRTVQGPQMLPYKNIQQQNVQIGLPSESAMNKFQATASATILESNPLQDKAMNVSLSNSGTTQSVPIPSAAPGLGPKPHQPQQTTVLDSNPLQSKAMNVSLSNSSTAQSVPTPSALPGLGTMPHQPQQTTSANLQTTAQETSSQNGGAIEFTTLRIAVPTTMPAWILINPSNATSTSLTTLDKVTASSGVQVPGLAEVDSHKRSSLPPEGVDQAKKPKMDYYGADVVAKVKKCPAHKLYVIMEILQFITKVPYAHMNPAATELDATAIDNFRKLYMEVYNLPKGQCTRPKCCKMLREVGILTLHQFGEEEASKVQEVVDSMTAIGLAKSQKANRLAQVLFTNNERAFCSATGKSCFPPFCESRMFVLQHAYFSVIGCSPVMAYDEGEKLKNMLESTAALLRKGFSEQHIGDKAKIKEWMTTERTKVHEALCKQKRDTEESRRLAGIELILFLFVTCNLHMTGGGGGGG